MKILITGTSKGLGAALAHFYLKNHHNVIGISRTKNSDLMQFDNFTHIELDLSVLTDIEPKLFECLDENTILDLVVLNAGILGELKPFSEYKLSEIEKIMTVNLWSNKLILDYLLNRLSQIKQVVAISSGAAIRAYPGWGAYSISKAALNTLILTYANEFDGTHFSSLAPGIIDTNMQDYISQHPNNQNYSLINQLKKAKGTLSMPKPDQLAPIVVQSFEKLKNLKSGKNSDIREL